MTKIDLEKTMELLGSTNIPGTPEELEQLVQWTQNSVNDKGEAWVRRHKGLLLDQWEYILSL